MIQIILASHGDLAKGMKDTLGMIIGDVSMVEAFSSYRNEEVNVGEIVEKIVREKYIEADIFIFTDILGGSVNTEMMSLIKEYPKIHVISGMNLPIIISVATQANEISESLLQQIIEESQQGIVDCNKLLNECKNIKEEDL
ncbi:MULTISPECIES: PTS sugar transporter subunit IIA [Clostridium]|jgi:Phosphotransferase system, mannose/fructose-specific component IIA|uniref:PTS fructose transporter subunit IIA n=2 Tax=Clostridium beijerinckii TaxID=1520 RepID=A0AAE2RR16_CLOBE|nr:MULTISPECIES: PTS fructose transporter subunit IIA [Clostridium]ABR36669.1 PTS system fructose subfamily IIA component [Clostridium beijerinckii NCIMB 8052]AIU03392.1 PTS system fructose subfamily IIA component [Clostridium beijerinckii ATCC 35702]AVK48494.1 PTS fructose transporter subunit IIA [Clostridium sp. MF28]MBF7808686.1 PTS fructose transporter subunit IIA [Clostridium beijerinckii]NOW89166.1 PTS system mannose-specific IIA component/fructoselysine and glucoselysine-specific PTS sy